MLNSRFPGFAKSNGSLEILVTMRLERALSE
jgi:hypothetical protein